MADALRVLALDTVEAAGSGQPQLALGMADVATVLWTRYLKFDAADPRWPDRDRFVLSAGHGSMLLYALLHLTGHAGMGASELKRFCQLHAPTAGHPEFAEHPAIETTAGPPGQGLSTAVGMAVAERMMAARFGKSLADHRTWVIACSDDLCEGVSHEASELAGHLRLEKLTVLYHDAPAVGGGPAPAAEFDQLRRFAAHGWAVKQVDAHDPTEIAGGLSFAVRSRKPTLIACHSAAARRGGMAASRQTLGWADQPPFTVPDRLAERWRAAGNKGAGTRRAWLKRAAHHPLRTEFERVLAGRLPDGWHEAVAGAKAAIAEAKPRHPTGVASRRALEALAAAVPELVGGSAERIGSVVAQVRGLGSVTPGNYGARQLPFGVRAQGMAACLNGMALHGGMIPFGGAFLVAADCMRPAIRMAAIMRQRVIHLFTHDSIGAGEDGAATQPVEQLASLRAMPNVNVFRPADAMETAECWELAIRRSDGPSLLVLTRQDVPALRADAGENRSARGGYVLAEAEGARRVTLIATGSEVEIAMAARDSLHADGLATAVVSLPCWELFAAQEESYRTSVLGGVPRVGIEAACGFGWERWLGEGGVFVGMTGFGASAPSEDLYRYFGITPEAVVTAVHKRLN